MKKILVSHPSGNANTRGVIDGLAKHGMLYRYVTSVALFHSSWWYRLTSIGMFQEFRKRTYSEILKGIVKCYPFKELGRQITEKLKWHNLTTGENTMFSPFSCCKYIDKKTSKLLRRESDYVDAVYCYEDVAMITFMEAKRLNKKCIYDLPIGHWRYMRQLLDVERTKNPEWAITLGKVSDSEEKLAQKDEELRLADMIFVPSLFVKNSLELFPQKLQNVAVIPFGCPPPNTNRQHKVVEGKIKLLYVGGLTQRKGISYLFEALEGLESMFDLTVVGAGRPDLCPALAKALNKHTYLGTLPHDKVLNVMSKHDIFVFPSLFEGFALVLNEALSQGTPCLTTTNAGIADYFVDGYNSWIVEAGSVEAIREKLLYLYDHKEEIVNAGKEALKTAAAHPWKEYEDRMAKSVSKFMNS